jgi:hypothetical protein
MVCTDISTPTETQDRAYLSSSPSSGLVKPRPCRNRCILGKRVAHIWEFAPKDISRYLKISKDT